MDLYFYLDDFPSPVPSGDGTYIKRDYGLSIKEFYTNIWWPDMLDMAEEHGVKYTGVIIDNYEDDVSGDVVEQEDVQRFQYFWGICCFIREENWDIMDIIISH